MNKLKKFAKKIWDYKASKIADVPIRIESYYTVLNEYGSGGGCYETIEDAKLAIQNELCCDKRCHVKHKYCVIKEINIREIVYVD